MLLVIYGKASAYKWNQTCIIPGSTILFLSCTSRSALLVFPKLFEETIFSDCGINVTHYNQIFITDLKLQVGKLQTFLKNKRLKPQNKNKGIKQR